MIENKQKQSKEEKNPIHSKNNLFTLNKPFVGYGLFIIDKF